MGEVAKRCSAAAGIYPTPTTSPTSLSSRLPPHQMAALRRVLTLLTLLVGLHITTAQGPDLCEPNCEGVPDGEMVADPLNCRQFYFCAGGNPTSEPFSCNAGEIFNVTESDCTPGVNCTPICGGTSSCSYECLTEVSMISDPYDCSKYYQCVDGSDPVELTCGDESPYFDGLQCQQDKTKCCHCKPYCYDDDILGTLVGDPVNCTNYFFCAEPSSFPENSGHCEEGEHFDFTSGVCSSSVPCITLCPDFRVHRPAPKVPLHPILLNRPRG